MTDRDARVIALATAAGPAWMGASHGSGSTCESCRDASTIAIAALTERGYVLVERKRAEKALAALYRWDCGQPAAPFNAALTDLHDALATRPAEGGRE